MKIKSPNNTQPFVALESLIIASLDSDHANLPVLTLQHPLARNNCLIFSSRKTWRCFVRNPTNVVLTSIGCQHHSDGYNMKSAKEIFGDKPAGRKKLAVIGSIKSNVNSTGCNANCRLKDGLFQII
jgi:hypothetical protein